MELRMSKYVSVSCAATTFAIALFATPAGAELHDRGGGLIYDDVLDITWMQDTNWGKTSGDDDDGRFTWDGAVAWAEGLEYYDSVRDVVWDDWRLPKADPVDGVAYDDTFSFDGSTDNAYNITSTHNELGYMFYVNLGVKGYVDPEGNWPVEDFGFRGELSGPFDRMLGAGIFPYWTGASYPPFDGMAYIMVFKTGSQHGANKDSELLTWVVRDGDVADVPAPPADIEIVSPVPGATLSGPVTLDVDPQNGNLKSVTYLLGPQAICYSPIEPYQCVWDSTNVPNAAYTIRAVGQGWDGTQEIELVNVTVAN